MARLENKIISILELIKTNSIRTRHVANIIYNDCMNHPNKANGGRVSAICRAANSSKFLKLEGDRIHFNKDGWPEK